MKHPILYRVGFYSCFVVLAASLLFLLHLLEGAPFKSSDMRNAYFDGCNIGFHSPLTDESVARCKRIADDYELTLDDLDRQMNNE